MLVASLKEISLAFRRLDPFTRMSPDPCINAHATLRATTGMPMTLKDRITDDMKTAMRAKDAPRLLTIRGLLAACKQREVDERVVLDDAAVIAIVDKLVKQRKDSITQFTAGNRPDLVAIEASELSVLEGYLPQRMDADAVAAEVTRIVAELGAELGRQAGPADMGKVMSAVKAQLAGKADMSLVSAAVKKALAQ
jgi:uncharacterized protein YqeY